MLVVVLVVAAVAAGAFLILPSRIRGPPPALISLDDADSHAEAPAAVARGAGRVLGTAAGIGLLVQLLFWDVGWGINFPLTVGALLVAGWLCGTGHSRGRASSTPGFRSRPWFSPPSWPFVATSP